MPQIIALDFGLKRTGIAISDDKIRIAMAHSTVDSTKLMTELENLHKTDEIVKIVIGFPTNLDGSPTNITQNVIFLKEAIQKRFPNISVEFHNEHFTSKMAYDTIKTSGVNKKTRQDKALVDKVSATIILQSYLSLNEME